MTAYAARAVPWALVLASCVVAAVLMALVAAWPDSVWPLQGATVGLLAGATAWSLDETAAAIVDTLPRPLRWRTMARTLAAGPLALTWAGSVLVAGDRLPPHPALLIGQGLAAVLFAEAFVTWRRARGSAAPGTRFASVVIVTTAMLALLRPLPDHLPLFPIWSYEPWSRSLTFWSALAVGSAALLVATLRD